MDSLQLPLDFLACSYFLPFHRRLSSVLAAHYDALYPPVSSPPFFNAPHLIVTGVEEKHGLKNTNTVDLLSKTKTAGWSALQKSRTHAHRRQDVLGRSERTQSWVCLFVCV